jgi:hypothetical protein
MKAILAYPPDFIKGSPINSNYLLIYIPFLPKILHNRLKFHQCRGTFSLTQLSGFSTAVATFIYIVVIVVTIRRYLKLKYSKNKDMLTITVDPSVFQALDRMTKEHRFASRSAITNDLLRQALTANGVKLEA